MHYTGLFQIQVSLQYFELAAKAVPQFHSPLLKHVDQLKIHNGQLITKAREGFLPIKSLCKGKCKSPKAVINSS
jgi:hypothetical protein